MSFVVLSSLLLRIAVGFGFEDQTEKAWDYNEDGMNISHWIEHWPECGGQYQSPIDVTFDTTNECSTPLVLDFTSTEGNQQFAIRNNGHSLQAIPLDITHSGGSEISGLEILHHTNDTNIRLKNPFFSTYKSHINSEYCFDSLHFHWGETNEYGSEHEMNNEDFPLELHLVHYSCDYHKLAEATEAYGHGDLLDKYDDDNVLGVIGVLFEIGEANQALDSILNDLILQGVHAYDSKGYTNLLSFYYTRFNLQDLLPENKQIIAYKGSLTTPPCYETVRWMVLKNKISVSLEQMERFRYILESTDLNDNMSPNWRPIQKLNNRAIYECKESIDAEIMDKNEIVDEHGEHDDHDDGTVHLEIGGVHEKWLWVAIGILLFVTGYLCYLVNCTTKGDLHEHETHSDEEQGNEEESSAIFDESI